ncbi:MAG: hypothetical protein K0S07_863 [Chlamydiales bacterium]|jgi:putative peptidoglycan lipid II flippase|nr:hypothetical protein [Chlamydiales bacterium]
MKDTHQSVLKGAKLHFLGTFLSRFSGLFRDMAMASSFGTSSHIAALMVAFRLAHLFRRILGEGAMQSAFIPVFEELRKEDPSLGYRFFQSLYLMVFCASSAIAILSMLLFGWLSFYSLEDGFSEILSLTCWMMPSLVFICLFGLNNCLLNCEKSFFIPSVAPVAFNAVWVSAALWLGEMPEERAVYYLALAIVLGCFCQWLVTLPKAWLFLKRHLDPLSWRNNFHAGSLCKLAKPLGLAVIGVSAAQINGVADSIFARFSELDGPAYLWYAIRLQQVPLALFSIAIAGALMPPLARAFKRGDMDSYHHLLEVLLKRSYAAIIPFTALLFAMGFTSVNVLFGKGEFGASSIIGTVKCLWGYSLGLMPMANIIIFSAAAQAKGDFKTPAWTTLIAIAVNVLLNALFIFGLGWSSCSVAIATSLSAWLQAYLLKSRAFQGPILSKKAAREVWMISLGSLIAAACSLAIEHFYIEPKTLVWLLQQEVPLFPTHFRAQIADFGLEFCAFFLSLAAFNALFKLKDLFIICHLLPDAENK